MKHIRKPTTFDDLTPKEVERRRKIIKALTGRPVLEITRKRISKSNTGKKRSAEAQKKMSDAKKGYIPWNKGTKGVMVAWNKGLKGYRAGIPHPWMREGKEHYNWQGGKSFEPYSVNWKDTLKRSIRERDKYICQICGKPQGNRALCVHHIDYDKKNCDPDNLVTLCRGCHTKTNYNRDLWKEYFSEAH